MARPPFRFRLGIFVFVAVIAACGPSGNTSQPVPLLVPSQSFTTSTTSSVAIPVAATGGIAVAATFPQTNIPVTITETLSTAPFSGVPPLSRARALASTSRRTLDATTQVNIIYVGFIPSAAVTLDGTPGVSVTLPSVTPGAVYYLAQYDPTSGWDAPAAGPGSISGSTVSFPINSSTTLEITPSEPLYVALYSVASGTSTASPSPAPATSTTPSPSASSTASPSLSPSPSPSPTPSPVPTPVVSPAVLTFDAGAPTSAPFTVSETNNSAAFTAAITCAAASPTPVPSPSPSPSPTPSSAPFVAELGATSATPVNGIASFTVVSGTQLGSCSIVVTDARSATATVTVNVDETNLGIFSVRRSAP